MTPLDWPHPKGGFAMGFPSTYCPACHARRAIRNWFERHGILAIVLDPCGHVVRRSADIEWRVNETAA